MLDISRSGRLFILALIFSASLFLALSYYRKTGPDAEIKLINVSEPRFIVNINTAGPDELERLPGIGPVLAGNIILYREVTGGFKEIEELKNIKGIGDKKFEKIEGFIAVGE